jgi:hypothetical protein
MCVPTPATRKVWVTRDFTPPLNGFCSVSSVLRSASAVTAGSLIIACTCLLRSLSLLCSRILHGKLQPLSIPTLLHLTARYLGSASPKSFRTLFKESISNRSFPTGLHGRCISVVANALAMLFYSMPSSLAARHPPLSDDRAFAQWASRGVG